MQRVCASMHSRPKSWSGASNSAALPRATLHSSKGAPAHLKASSKVIACLFINQPMHTVAERETPAMQLQEGGAGG